jgi:hypothetical protein
MVMDDDDVLGSINYPNFRDHRHDQAILSLFAKKWNLTIYPNPSQYGRQKLFSIRFNHYIWIINITWLIIELIAFELLFGIHYR